MNTESEAAVMWPEMLRRMGMPEFCDWQNDVWTSAIDPLGYVVAFLALAILAARRLTFAALAVVMLLIGAAVIVHPVEAWNAVTRLLHEWGAERAPLRLVF